MKIGNDTMAISPLRCSRLLYDNSKFELLSAELKNYGYAFLPELLPRSTVMDARLCCFKALQSKLKAGTSACEGIAANPDLSAEQVIDYSREHLTAYKVPKIVEFYSELPKTNVGKILRRALR